MENTKICPKCGEEKKFYKDKRRKDGLRCYCIDCEKEYNQKNESKYKETRKKYRKTERYKELKRKYYWDNKEKVLKENAAWRQTFKGRLLAYTRSAKQRNIEWLLNEEEFKSFWNLPCSYCGEDIETIGIDRIDSNKPYKIDNCTSCCSSCNKMKLNLSEKEFLLKIKKIYNNLF